MTPFICNGKNKQERLKKRKHQRVLTLGVSGGSSLIKKEKEGRRKRKKRVKYKQVIKLGNKSGQERERRRSSFKPWVMRGEAGRRGRVWLGKRWNEDGHKETEGKREWSILEP